MANKLDEIIAQKHREVQQLKDLLAQDPQHPIAQLLQGKISRPQAKAKSFKQALRKSQLAVIAEIKRKSPSKGVLAEIKDPIQLAQTYIAGGADALSILTDHVFFAGHLDDLTKTAHAIKHNSVPILRKDFTIDQLQIAEALIAGADAILLIVAVLGVKTKILLEQACEMGIDVLVEVHNQAELDIALNSGAEIIGINSRDLTTFEIHIDRALELVTQIPPDIIKVAESGIHDPKIAQRFRSAGFDAVLIGEALVTSEQPKEFIAECKRI